MSIWLFITGLAAYGVWFILNEWRRVSLFRRRHDHRVLWMRAFRAEDRSRIDALLATICGAFLIPRRFRFRLRPSDDIHEFYRRNMRGQFADSLEYEGLVVRLKRDFAVSADQVIRQRPCKVRYLVRLVANPTALTTEQVASPSRR